MTARISLNVLGMAICIAITYFALLYAIMAVGLLGWLICFAITGHALETSNALYMLDRAALVPAVFLGVLIWNDLRGQWDSQP